MRSVLYTAVAAELVALNAYVTELLIGDEHVRRNDAPPRYIVVPNDDEYGPVVGPGGNPRGLFGVFKSSELIVHATSFDVCEGMTDQFMIALRKAVKGASTATARAGELRVSKGKFTRGNAMHARNGVEYKVTFAVGYAIVDRKWDAPAPGDPPRPPVPSTYTGAELLTYPIVSGAELTITADVGRRDNPPADDNVTITVPTPAP